MRVLLTGGGTGGHLFPGIALAQELSLKSAIHNPQSAILFLCTQRPFDSKQLARYGFKYYALPSPRLSFSPLFIIQAGRQLCGVATESRPGRRGSFRPDVVVGLGGYGSFAPLVIALLKGIPVVMLEQNLLPGRITRLLSPFAKRIFCQWSGTKRYLYRRNNVIHSGSPLRRDVTDSPQRLKDSKSFVPSCLRGKRVLAIIGGSQGAEALNQAVVSRISHLASQRIGIIHLTGEKDFNMVKSAYEQAGIQAFVAPFYEDMAAVYQAADLVVSRAGGIAIAEMTAFGLPVVLVPYPYAADDHQTLNAQEVAKMGAGLFIRQSELDSRMPEIIQLFRDDDRLKQMSARSSALAKPNAGTTIARYIMNYGKETKPLYEP
ncbi:MAG: UDP-N-acetylglucosamine--N-acetylmuramyl-(pentapeptide) pyrophosphoryl-undecaprenol N-acetylglucosamine transferase [Planctomycetes bacterium]|nr:UDP-N-acetylglucosamine--N-acetylmuramyl-(pentapeptide) pyrophosphoryl-undecaprenol N-acetylglucosamine transferase [Planctomycetota bacterium]